MNIKIKLLYSVQNLSTSFRATELLPMGVSFLLDKKENHYIFSGLPSSKTGGPWSVVQTNSPTPPQKGRLVKKAPA